MTSTTRADLPKGRWRQRWPTIKKYLSYAFFILVAGLLIGLARNLDWKEIIGTLQSYQLRTLWLAGAAAFGSYLVYCFFDVLGKYYVRHGLPIRQIVPLTFVCYAFNLNLSAWVGGIALRYRLYSRLGVKPAQVTRIFTLSLLTNWLGYMALAGVIFTFADIRPPPEWEIGSMTLHIIGFSLMAVSVTYLLLCGFSKRRSWTIRGHEVELPSLRLAVIQILLGAANWSLMATVIYFMLLEKISYPEVLAVLMVSSIAGVISHVPAGLGVIEAVFVGLLGSQMSHPSIIAGLIGYRVIYFLVPLVFATIIYVVLEARAKKLRRTAAAQNGATS